MEHLQWKTSSYSWKWDELKCISLARLPNGDLAVRDSKNPDGPMLSVSRAAGAAFIKSAPDLAG